MNIRLIKASDFASCTEVTSPKLMDKDSREKGGLLSNEIFGDSIEDKKKVNGYISLGGKFFHPGIYVRVLKTMWRDIDKVVAGSLKVRLDPETGRFVPDPEGETGIEYLIKNIEKSFLFKGKVGKGESITSKYVKGACSNLGGDAIYVHNFFVMPLAYRDINIGDGSSGYDEINTIYARLINYTKTYKDESLAGVIDRDSFAFFIQKTLVDLHQYVMDMLGGKFGLQRKAQLSKPGDFFSRDVMSAQTITGKNVKECMIDLDTTGVPLSTSASEGALFVLHWMNNFFRNKFERGELGDIDEDEFHENFNEEYYRKLIVRYKESWSERIKKIPLPNQKGKYLTIDYDIINDDGSVEKVTKNMTTLELLYLASYFSIELPNRPRLNSRYPIQDSFNIFANKTKILSTNTNMKVNYDGTEIMNFPDLRDLEAEFEKVTTYEEEVELEILLSARFQQTLKISNMHLPGLDGDFDGDTLTGRLVQSDEATKECMDNINSPSFLFDISGNLVKFMTKEATISAYAMTKNPNKDEKAKVVDENTVNYILEAGDDLEYTWVMRLCGDYVDKPKQYNFYDIVEIPVGAWNGNKEKIHTTLGRLLMNSVVFRPLGQPFYNTILDSGNLRDIYKKAGIEYMEGRITNANYKASLNYYERFTLKLAPMVSPSISLDVVFMNEKIRKRKAELMDEYKEDIANGNFVVMDRIEHEIIELSKKELEGNPMLDIYESKASKLKWGNDYKGGGISIGAVPDITGQNFSLVTSNFIDGTTKQDIVPLTNSMILGAFMRGKNPEIGGTYTKLINQLMQILVLDHKGSDCGTNRTMPIDIDKGDYNHYIGSYILEGGTVDDKGEVKGGKLIKLGYDNIEDYIGKTVRMRSPASCQGKNPCSVCCGDLPYLTRGDKPNLGLETGKRTTELTQKSLQQTHDMSVKIIEVKNLDDYFV